MAQVMNFDFLTRAIETNDRMTLYYKNELGKIFTFGSRFFDYKKKKYIVIDRPYGEKGTYQQLVKKDRVVVFFICKGFRFKFTSEVLGKDKYKLRDTQEIPVLLLQMPKEIYDGERRNFFRVPAPMEPPITVKFLSYFDSNQSFEIQEVPELKEAGMKEAILNDLSGGGLSIRSAVPMEIMTGDILNLRFRLGSSEMEEIQIEGLTNNSRKTSDNALIKGIEFIPDRSDSYRNANKRIARYVMERQRAMITPYGKL